MNNSKAEWILFLKIYKVITTYTIFNHLSHFCRFKGWNKFLKDIVFKRADPPPPIVYVDGHEQTWIYTT